ncbi:MAG: hypothetical protein OEL81_06365 [Nitrosopumilus sp.]|nr:hypothetical protein [Nitrosopumilus sp.]
MISVETSHYRVCCNNEPTVIMIFDDVVIAVCDYHDDDAFRYGVKRIFDYKTGEEVK